MGWLDGTKACREEGSLVDYMTFISISGAITFANGVWDTRDSDQSVPLLDQAVT